MKIVGRTDTGKVRTYNQDAFDFDIITTGVCFAVVCDGMGGEQGGNVASSIACEMIGQKMRQGYRARLDDNSFRNLMMTSISAANAEIYEKAQNDSNLEGMGTTVILVAVVNKKLHIAHVGDSRAYLIMGNKISRLTKDHSVIQELIERGKISEKQAKTHPNKNYITRAVGVEKNINIDYADMIIDSKSKILLCSDGLTNCCSDEEIAAIVSEYDADTACIQLLEKANAAGGFDNITVIIIS